MNPDEKKNPTAAAPETKAAVTAEKVEGESAPIPPEASHARQRGFATMDRAKVREIARKGGVAAHRSGTAHRFSSDEARKAGRKGGSAPHRTRGRKTGGANGVTNGASNGASAPS